MTSARNDVVAAVPLSHAQAMMWFLDRVVPDPAAYNVPIAWRIAGPVDLAALGRAVDRLVQRHDQLRTAFAAAGGEPVAVPAARARVPVRTCPAPDDVAAALREEARRPFDLAQAPLARALLLRGDETSTLVVTFHHIVCDGRSLAVVQDDLLELYDAECAGREAALLPVATTYAQFARNDRDAARDGAYDDGLNWWADHLRDLPRFELAGDRRPPAAPSGRGGRASRALGPAATAGLRSCARAQRVTPFSVLLAAFVAFLARHAQAADVVVGVPLGGRRRPELERVVGTFTETAVLRAHVEPARPFAELVRALHDELLDALTYGDVPFARVVERVAPLRSQSRNPLFTVAMVEQAVLPAAAAGGARFTAAPVDTATAKFDLLLEVTAGADDVTVTFEYAADLFDHATADAMIETFRVLVTRALDDPATAVEDVALVDAAAAGARPVVVGSAAGASGAAFVHRRFRAHAVAVPDAIALRHGETVTTYGELLRDADAIRAALVARGVRPGDLVGLCARRSCGLIAAIVAILDAGAAYVPLDPHAPAQRLRHIADDAGLAHVVADAASPAPAGRAGTPALLIEDALRTGTGRAAPPPADVGPSDPAYVIYTSGSTGRPKGVVVEHGNVARLFTAADRHFAFGPADTWTLFHSYAFDFSVWEMWGALAYGGQLVVVPAAVAREPGEVLRLVAELGVTVLNLTPSVFYELDAADAAQPRPLQLRYVVLGGEAVEPRRLAAWFARHGDGPPTVANMYGITETTVHVSFRALRASDADAVYGPIGVPLADLEIVLRDAKGRPVPAGFVGEMDVRGAGVARGYLNDAALTADRFRAVPGPDGPVRAYRSGDLARRRADGSYEYVGRADQQVKIRGFRIEPAEIEAALASHPGIARAVVLPQTSGGATRLVAYVVPRRDDDALDDLGPYLGGHVPAYMIPSAFVRVRAVPLTENGKADRRALAAHELPRPRVAVNGAAATSVLQAQLRTLFEDCLAVGRVGLDDNFFALGGHSLLAARLVARVGEAFGPAAARFELSGGRTSLMRVFYRNPTVRGLADALGGAARAGGTIACMREGDAACTPVFWFHGAYQANGLYVWNLVNALPRTVPFYVVVPHGQDGNPFAADIGALTADRLADIRRVRPHGPYVLGGFCNGAVMAFEAACRLRAAGELVEHVVMVSPAPLVPLGPRLSDAVHWTGARLGLDGRARTSLVLALRTISSRLERLVRGAPEQRAAVADGVRRLLLRVSADAGLRPEAPAPVTEVDFRYVDAVTRYRARRYDGAADIVYGTNSLPWMAKPDGGWAAHVAAAAVHAVPDPVLSADAMTRIGTILRAVLAAREKECSR